MRPRTRTAFGIVVLVACLGLAACARPGTGPTSNRGPVSLEDVEAAVAGASTLRVSVPSCNGDPVVEQLVEDEDVVRLQVVTTVTDPGDGCLDSIDVELQEPFGDRALVDLTSGAEVTVRPQP